MQLCFRDAVLCDDQRTHGRSTYLDAAFGRYGCVEQHRCEANHRCYVNCVNLDIDAVK